MMRRGRERERERKFKSKMIAFTCTRFWLRLFILETRNYQMMVKLSYKPYIKEKEKMLDF